ncbi:MAG: UDP-N-acetylenolpyruvoylglucosamine reductase [Candidatus Magasanikbacteria bacterium GW2011_GWC2_40_17]|uniref:UDP-N-acetylenolpyruvoylglucosamine reductase n=1 Tax=Candidatus Magasanikbacteria bacterium GW2011_GWA2_42_32 TaxID=1619039 RepID=A0A0G1A8S8_9BACT|nr:MAG: UDP-N-acetylenolpyruvoylglucosamine reductase [Candidatus Magasanikbacteria bacterium GW2011_GWC2_40_17]KKS57452.1 MAG: UDP-N-acetylenolpyruvoylglucosamine reductase [Candidatus Magasanikbacteria bacterium GW2011_GWA2_42_32]
MQDSPKIKENISLAQFTTFKIGGPAKFFTAVFNIQELKEAVAFGEKNKLPIFILGGGSNLLFPDAGWPGLVIKISFIDFILPDPPYELGKKYMIKVGSGESISSVAKKFSQLGLCGLEWAGGLPGTVGGAVRGNAGAFRLDIGQNIKEVDIFYQGKISKMTAEECVFSYRTSLFKSIFSEAIILSCSLELTAGDPAESQKQLQGYLAHRSKSQPNFPSAGCIFKNFTFDKEEEIKEPLKSMMTENFWQFKKVPAAWLVEQAGLKGLCVGGAEVSTLHGNFIVNTNQATTEDILNLIKKIKEIIYQKFGVTLEEEVQIVKLPN